MELTNAVKHEIKKYRRLSGKSLSAVLMCISRALQNPNTEIELVDYEPFVDLPKRRVQETVLIPIYKRILKQLGLKHFWLNKLNNSIRYDLQAQQEEFLNAIQEAK